MAPKKRTVLKEISLENLNLEDVFCIACRCIYLQPVTMPCGHTLCLECFKNMVNLTAYQCPTCRMRISNWLRKNKNDWVSLVNERLWQALQLQYPVEIQKRLNDEDDGIEERIANQGFTRVQIQEGEVKKEFENLMMMSMMSFQQEQKKLELQNIELAKQLQKAEEVNKQARKVENERLIQDDVKFASAIQEEVQKELEQEEENSFHLALQLQEKGSDLNESKFDSTVKTIKTSSKLNLPKKGPLDRMFGFSLDPRSSCTLADSRTKLSVTDPFTNYSFTDPCTSSTFTDPSTSSSFVDSCASPSFRNPCPDLSVIDSGVFEDDNLDVCTCGRLKDNINSEIPPCQFCKDQIALLNELFTQQKNDYLMAKELQESFRKEHFEDYNLRKRSASPTKKVTKFRKRQQTLTEAMFNKR